MLLKDNVIHQTVLQMALCHNRRCSYKPGCYCIGKKDDVREAYDPLVKRGLYQKTQMILVQLLIR